MNAQTVEQVAVRAFTEDIEDRLMRPVFLGWQRVNGKSKFAYFNDPARDNTSFVLFNGESLADALAYSRNPSLPPPSFARAEYMKRKAVAA